MPSTRALRAGLVCAAILSVSLMGCSGDDPVEVRLADPKTFFWALSLDIQNTTVAIGGTQQVVATPRNSAGEALDGLPVPVFSSMDTTKVTVTQNGVITGLEETSGIGVIATLTTNGITHADTTMVAVTPESHTPASLTVVRDPGGEMLAVNDYVPLTVVVTDVNGDTLNGLSIELESLNPNILTPSAGELAMYASGLGTGRILVRTTSYGVTLSDTVQYSVGYPMLNSIIAQRVDVNGPLIFSPSAVVIGVNGSVAWLNFGDGPINVTFENGLENVEGGNIDDLEPFDFSNGTRTFLAAGTYHFKNALNGQTGEVVVRENP